MSINDSATNSETSAHFSESFLNSIRKIESASQVPDRETLLQMTAHARQWPQPMQRLSADIEKSGEDH